MRAPRTRLLGRSRRGFGRFRFGLGFGRLGDLDLGFGFEIVQMLHQALLLNLLRQPRLDAKLNSTI